MPESIPIACSLDEGGLEPRADELTELGGSMLAVEAADRGAVLRFPADRRDGVEKFVRAESACCPFFGFDVVDADDAIELRVSVPEDGEWALRGLVAGFVAGWRALV